MNLTLGSTTASKFHAVNRESLEGLDFQSVLQIVKLEDVSFTNSSLSNIMMKPEVPGGWEHDEISNLGSKLLRLFCDLNIPSLKALSPWVNIIIPPQVIINLTGGQHKTGNKLLLQVVAGFQNCLSV